MSVLQDNNNSVAKLLECPLCLDTFKKPKVLPCQHSFCLNCIYKAFKSKTTPPIYTCPVCNAEVKFEKSRTGPKSEAELNVLLPNNFTLMNLKEIYQMSSNITEQKLAPAYENQDVSKKVDQQQAEVVVAATTKIPTSEKPKPFPRQPIKPLPNAAFETTPTNNQKHKRLSVIVERPEISPPQPLRRLPNQNIKLLTKLEPEFMDILKPKKFLIDFKRNVFLIFFETNSGIRKYNAGDGGAFLMKFAGGTEVILDFVLDSKSNDTLICLTASENEAQSKSLHLQTYNTENGQRLKYLKPIDYEDNYRLIACSLSNNQEYILAGGKYIAVYSKKDNTINRLPDSTSLPDLTHLIAIDCTKTGNLYLLFGDQQNHSPIVYVFSLATSIAYALPILSIDFLSPRSISVTSNDFYICDDDSRCVSVYRKAKPEIMKAENVLSRANYYNWKPIHVIVQEKLAYVLDAEKKAVYMCNVI